MTKFVSAIYFFCAATVMILTLIFFSHSEYIPFPDAMLPIKLYELASIWLAIGFLPMILFTIPFYFMNRRRIFLVPAIISFGFFVFWAIIIIWDVMIRV